MKYKFNTKIIKPRGPMKTLRSVKASNTNIVIPKDVKHRVVNVNINDAKSTQDLGGGFRRFAFFYDIDPLSFFTFFFHGRDVDPIDYKPVSGGWWAANNTSDILVCNSNYSDSDYEWVTVLYNPYNYTRAAAFVIIAKT